MVNLRREEMPVSAAANEILPKSYTKYQNNRIFSNLCTLDTGFAHVYNSKYPVCGCNNNNNNNNNNNSVVQGSS
jgi:hypothetical protein